MRVYLRISLLLLTLLCFSTLCFSVSFLFASVLVLLQLFFSALFSVSLEKNFSLVVFLLFDFMELHMREVAVCKFTGSRFAFVVIFS